ncbi:MAG: hypothetical protein ACR2NM_11715 [Bythopirellula sp.]
MSRSNQQFARLIQELMRGVRSGKIKVRWILAVAVLGVGYLLLQPVLERSLGVDLPGLRDLSSRSQSTEAARSDADPPTAPPPPKRNTKSVANELQKILNSGSSDIYQSAAGLRYTRGSQHGHRLKHLMAHTKDLPDRPGQHGVFDSDQPADVVALVDEAYLQAQSGRDTRTRNEGERIVYDVNLRRRIGYIGGESGNRRNRPAAKHLRLVVEGDRLITAFPVTP